MEQTPGWLIGELQARGWPTTSRKLTDWVRKGLLPPLKARSLGRGKGCVWLWGEADVLAQAVAVHTLLEHYGWVDRLYVPLWLLGFKAPVEKVREGLLRYLDSGMEALRRNSDDPEMKWLVFDAAITLTSSRQGRQMKREGAPADELCALMLGAWFDPNNEPDENDVRTVVQHLEEKAKPGLDRLPGKAAPEVEQWVGLGLQFARQHLSRDSCRRAVETATEDEFREVQGDVIQIRSLVGDWLEAFASPEEASAVDQFLVRCNELARPLALADLSLRQAGRGARIDRLLRVASVYTRRLISNRQFRQEVLQRVNRS